MLGDSLSKPYFNLNGLCMKNHGLYIPHYCCFYMLVHSSQCDKLLYTSVQTSSSYIFGWYSQLFIKSDFPYLVCIYDQPCHKKQTVKSYDALYLAGTDNHTNSLRMERSGWEKENGMYHVLLDYIDCAMTLPSPPKCLLCLATQILRRLLYSNRMVKCLLQQADCALPAYQTTETVNSN